MRLTESQLRNKIRSIVNENLLKESERVLVRNRDEVYLVDDEGNEEYFGDSDVAEEWGLWHDGDTVTYTGRPQKSSYAHYSKDPYGISSSGSRNRRSWGSR